jgi:hypothetical protein
MRIVIHGVLAPRLTIGENVRMVDLVRRGKDFPKKGNLFPVSFLPLLAAFRKQRDR